MKISDGKTSGVITEDYDIDAEYVVNCAGMWAREFGKKAGVNVPLHAANTSMLLQKICPS